MRNSEKMTDRVIKERQTEKMKERQSNKEKKRERERQRDRVIKRERERERMRYGYRVKSLVSCLRIRRGVETCWSRGIFPSVFDPRIVVDYGRDSLENNRNLGVGECLLCPNRVRPIRYLKLQW